MTNKKTRKSENPSIPFRLSGSLFLFWGVLLISYGTFMILRNQGRIPVSIPWTAVLLLAMGGTLLILAWQRQTASGEKKKQSGR